MRILIDKKGKKYLLDEDADLHTNHGYIKKDDLKKIDDCQIIKTHLGHEFTVLKPNLNDYIDIMERRCSIILPKDIGIITSYTCLGSGQVVVEAGTGSGATALYFANIVGPNGKVHSYELREDFADIARKNISNYGQKNVEVKWQDITNGIDENDVDLIFLDLPKPWDVIEDAVKTLKIGGYFASYNPYIEQVFTLHKVLKKFGFSDVNSLECILRDIEVKSKGTRPKTRMVGHTGYLTFARLLEKNLEVVYG